MLLPVVSYADSAPALCLGFISATHTEGLRDITRETARKFYLLMTSALACTPTFTPSAHRLSVRSFSGHKEVVRSLTNDHLVALSWGPSTLTLDTPTCNVKITCCLLFVYADDR